MFRREKVGEDILLEMEANLISNAFAQDTKLENEKLQVLELLEKAASSFEKARKPKEAEAITKIIEFVADPPEEIEKQVENLKETGTQFSKEEYNEDKLYEEYLKDPDILDEISVDEDNEEDNINEKELAALKHLW